MRQHEAFELRTDLGEAVVDRLEGTAGNDVLAFASADFFADCAPRRGGGERGSEGEGEEEEWGEGRGTETHC